MFIILGFIFAPLERLMPFSRKWLGDKDTPTDFMLFLAVNSGVTTLTSLFE
jgi:hypothetical protein